MEQDKVQELLEKYITAYNQLDIETMMQCFTDDCTFLAVSGGRQIKVCRNARELRQTAEQTAGYFKTRKQTPLSIITDGNKAAVEFHYTATVKSDLPNGLKAGQKLEVEGVSIFTVKKDRIVKLIDYT